MANTDGDDETPNQRAARKRKELEAPDQAPVLTRLPKEKKVRNVSDYTESLLFLHWLVKLMEYGMRLYLSFHHVLFVFFLNLSI